MRATILMCLLAIGATVAGGEARAGGLHEHYSARYGYVQPPVWRGKVERPRFWYVPKHHAGQWRPGPHRGYEGHRRIPPRAWYVPPRGSDWSRPPVVIVVPRHHHGHRWYR